MKQCQKCGQLKELSLFVKRGNGTRNICKDCYNLSKRKTPVQPAPKDGFKFCAKCGTEKPIAEFNVRLVAGKRKAFSYCKPCEHEVNNSRYAHKCARCGKEYRSGRKDNLICNSCKVDDFSAVGRDNLIRWNSIPENNPWYGKPRFGAQNPNYDTEKTDEERELGRIIPGYKEWVRSVYERDKYTCQCCGDNRGHNLNAHHLDGYNWCKEKRLDISNGVTLCETCHIMFHRSYGFHDNTREQYEEFKNSNANMLIPR